MFKRLSAFAGTVAVALALLIAPAAQAAGPDDLLNVRDGVCDFAAAGLGHGSVSDPFSISTPAQLAEMSDCSVRQANITNAVGDGTSITYTADNSFGVGQVVDITNMNPSTFDKQDARITAVTATSFTVAGTTTDSFVNGGNVTDTHSFYSIDADINLAAGTTSWNLVQEATISNVVGDGSTITFTAPNSFTAGQEIIIEGVKPMVYSMGRATVVSADANSFTVNGSATDAYVSGGSAYSNGWQPISGRNNQFEKATVLGNGHTISNLTIHRNESNQGLFRHLRHVNILDLNLTDIMVSSAGDGWTQRTGGLTGSVDYGSLSNITVNGTVYGLQGVGLLGGRVFAEASNIDAAGEVGARKSYVNPWDTSYYIGGVAGEFYGVATNITADVDVDGTLRSGVAGETYGRGTAVGGVFGTTDGAFRDITSAGDVIGGNEVGGVFGYNCCGDIVNVVATGDVYGISDTSGRKIEQIGGVIGEWGCCGAIRDSHAEGDIIIINDNASAAIEYVGGFAGTNWCCGLMVNSYATGDVIVTTAGPAASSIGGFLGVYDCCNNIDNVWASGDITVNNGYWVGGLVGSIDSSESGIENSHYEGTITVGYDGEARVGGLIGSSEYDITVSNSYVKATINVSPFSEGGSAEQVGGLVGYVDEMLVLRDSYFRGSVSGSTKVAGFVGDTQQALTDIQRSYVSATVTATGTNPVVDAAVTGEYSDIHKTSVYDSTVAGAVSSQTGMLAKTSTELKTKATLTALGWSFDPSKGPWKISASGNDGFPDLVLPVSGGGASLPAATVSWAPITKVTTVTTAPSVLATANSAGAITYAVTNAGATGCTVNATTGALSFAAAGNCVVTATVASDGTYAEASVSVTFSVTRANCKAINLGNVNFAKGSASLNAGSRKQIAGYVTQIVSRGCGAVNVFGRGATTSLAKQRAFVVKNAMLARLTNKGVSVRFTTKWAKNSANTVGLVGQNK